MLTISKVYKNGVAYELGIKKGDLILAFDGFDVVDILDYVYYDSQTDFTLTVKSNNEVIDYDIEKDEFESLGLEFVSDNLEIKNCYNNCVFCFVDQMPPNMRETLYVKDDDYRQSFLIGNFVTLTNVKDSDIDRIIRLNLSPLYVSVQATDSEVRKKLLNNRFAGDIMAKLKKLTQGGIKVHTQVVLVPGLNDGAVLDNTCNDLYGLGENVLSIAVVPCGITKYREGLYPIKDIDKGYATCVINQIKWLNIKFNKNLVVAGDEFYFRSGQKVESEEYYGDFAQIENGVGLTTKFELELNESLKKKTHNGSYLIISGTSASDYVKERANLVSGFVKGGRYEVLAVENDFFGKTVNCTGLLVGKDILSAIKNKNLAGVDGIVIPAVCLKRDEDVFLDGLTVEELSSQISKKIIITDGSGQSFFDALSGGKNVRIIK